MPDDPMQSRLARTENQPSGGIAALNRRVHQLWLAGVTVSFLIISVVVLPIDRGVEWDEAVYLSQYLPGAVRIPLSAHRAVGITWLSAPIAVVTDSIVATRLWMSVLAAGSLFGAFFTWIRSIGAGAVAGFAILATSWLTLLYAGEVSPNIYSGALAVAAIGVIAGYRIETGRATWWVLSGLVAASVILRPTDALFLSIALVLGGIYSETARIKQVVTSLAVGGAAGMIPWLIESYANFGGPLPRLEAAGKLVGGGWTSNLREYVLLSNGPLVGPDNDGLPSSLGIWLLLVAALAVVGLVASGRRSPPRLAIIGAVLMSLPYLFYTEAMAPRFLLPTLALMGVVAGVGLMMLLRRLDLSNTAAVAFFAIGVMLALQIPHATAFGSSLAVSREVSLMVANEIERRVDDSECLVASRYGYPQISLGSGCEGTRLSPEDLDSKDALTNRIRDLANRGAGRRLAVVTWFDAEHFGVLDRWERYDLIGPDGSEVEVYILP